MSRFIADENFPFPSFKLILQKGIDIIHIGVDRPSIDDESVLGIARDEDRILITLDRDHGELIFTRKIEPPRGIIYFRIAKHRPAELGERLVEMITEGFVFDGYFTVITKNGLRQRKI